MRIKRLHLGLVCSLAVVLAGCGSDSESPGVAVRAALTPVPHAAWLSRHLPAEAIAYARVPTLWDIFSEPKEDALHSVQAGSVHAAQLAAIRQGLQDNVISQLPPPARLPAETFLNRLRSPLEVVALKPADGSLAPNSLLAVQLDFADAAAFGDWLTQLTELSPQLRVLTPVDADGYLTLVAGPVPVYGHFNVTEGRLLLLSGMSASQTELKRYAGAAAAESSLSEFERGVDASGRGLALWLDISKLYPMYAPMIPPEQSGVLKAAGLDQARYLWLGAASKGGKSSFKIHLAMPEIGFRRLLARPDQAPGLNSAGAARFVLRLALPTLTEVVGALDYALSLSPDGTAVRGQLAGAKSKLDAALGFDSRLLLEAFGPEVLVVGDAAGFWAGYQVRDRGALDRVIAGVQEKTGAQIGRHRAGGVEINHWALPAMWMMPDELEDDPQIPEPLMRMLKRLKSRLYWIEESGYLVMAGVPQVLAARAQIGANWDIGGWLAKDMRLDWRHSVLAFASQVHYSPRDIYHGYLSFLYFMADVVGAEIDPFALPTWIDAGLPEYGRLGLRIDSGPDAIGLSLDYEYSPVEMLFSGNSAMGLALVGIGAAIAIPAYHDYTVRAQVVQGLSVGAAYKLTVAEMRYSTGRFPDQTEGLEMTEGLPISELVTVEIQPDTGIVGIYFTAQAQAQLAGKSIYLEPIEEDGYLSWVCYSEEIQSRHLPASCRE